MVCVHLIKGLLVQAFGSCEPTRVASAAELQSGHSKNPLIFHDTPEHELIELLVLRKTSLIAYLSSADINIQELMDLWAMPIANAICQTSLSVSAVEEVVATPDVLVIRSHGSKKTDIRRLLTHLASFLGLESYGVNFDNIIHGLRLQTAPDGNVYLEDQIQLGMTLTGCKSRKQTETDYSRKLVSHLNGYNSILQLTPMSTICWPGELFSTDKNEPAGVGQTVNLMGPARVLVYGPYFGLPRGRWRATIKFSVSNNYSGNKLLLDISQNYSKDLLVKGESNLPESGSFSCDMSFLVTNHHLPIEVRLATKEGAIEGELEFFGVDLKRH